MLARSADTALTPRGGAVGIPALVCRRRHGRRAAARRHRPARAATCRTATTPGARARRARRRVRRAARADRRPARADARPPPARRGGTCRCSSSSTSRARWPRRHASARRRVSTAPPRPPSGCAPPSRPSPPGSPSLTDRVLPQPLPRAGRARVSRGCSTQGVAIENPPPQCERCPRDVVRRARADPRRRLLRPQALDSRIVVVLTDGESTPVQTGEVAAAFAAQPGYHVLFVRFWRPGEAIYDADGHAESAYRPDPSGGAVARLARLGTRRQRLRRERARQAPSSACGNSRKRCRDRLAGRPSARETPLAPFSAGLALARGCRARSFWPGSARRVRWILS